MGTVTVLVNQFINQVESYGMPVKFLRFVATKYTFGETSGTANTNTWLNNMDLKDSDVDSLKAGFRPGGTQGEASTVQTIYHEGTHAYLDLRDGEKKFKDFIQDGESYYKDAPLEGGKTAKDPSRILTEAAAGYVGDRAAAWYGTYDFIEALREGVDQATWAGKGNKDLYDRMDKIARKIPGDYDRSMRDRVFGYEERWGNQIPTTKPISASIKVFCDTEILEGKIPDAFDSSAFLKERHQSLLDLIQQSRTIVPVEVDQ